MSDSAASPLRGPRQFAVARRMALGIAVLYAVFSTLWIVTSDRLLPVLGGSPEQIAWLGTVKGVLFVLVTSSLIYALLRLAPRTAGKGGIPRTHGLLLAAIFALLAAAILAIGYQVQQHGLRSVEARFFASLRAVTDSKARQVEDWLGAQSRQVTAIATSHAVVDHGPAALEGDPGAHRELVAELQAMAAAFGLDAIAVADALGNPLLAAGRTPDPGLLAPAIADAKRRQPGFSGARQGRDGMSRGAFALPLPRRGLDDPGRRYLVAVVDLERTLKPLVSRWSLPDSAGESTLQLSEQRFRNTFNLNAVGMTHIASDGRFLMVNARAAELLGYSVAELEQLGIRQVVLAEDMPVALKQFEALQVGRIEEYTLDLRCRRQRAWPGQCFHASPRSGGGLRCAP